MNPEVASTVSTRARDLETKLSPTSSADRDGMRHQVSCTQPTLSFVNPVGCLPYSTSRSHLTHCRTRQPAGSCALFRLLSPTS